MHSVSKSYLTQRSQRADSKVTKQDISLQFKLIHYPGLTGRDANIPEPSACIVFGFQRSRKRCITATSHYHAAIAFYLHNKAKVDDYLVKQEVRKAKIRKELEKYSKPGMREILLARRRGVEKNCK